MPLPPQKRRRNGHLPNVDFRVADVTALDLPLGGYDVVFSNWLLMYLSDAEVAALMANALGWVGCCWWLLLLLLFAAAAAAVAAVVVVVGGGGHGRWAGWV
jgi:hypothetical protein